MKKKKKRKKKTAEKNYNIRKLLWLGVRVTRDHLQKQPHSLAHAHVVWQYCALCIRGDMSQTFVCHLSQHFAVCWQPCGVTHAFIIARERLRKLAADTHSTQHQRLPKIRQIRRWCSPDVRARSPLFWYFYIVDARRKEGCARGCNNHATRPLAINIISLIIWHTHTYIYNIRRSAVRRHSIRSSDGGHKTRIRMHLWFSENRISLGRCFVPVLWHNWLRWLQMSSLSHQQWIPVLSLLPNTVGNNNCLFLSLSLSRPYSP